MEKSIEETIFETREIMKQVIVESKLSPMILEMILKELYLDVQGLASELLQRNIVKRKEAEQKEVSEEDGGHK